MQVKNPGTYPVEVDGGRMVASGEFADVNSRRPLAAAALRAGRLVSVHQPAVAAQPDEPDEE